MSKGPAAARRVLLLEDDASLGATLKEALESRGYHVTWSRTLAEARRQVSAAAFDIAVLDVGLPDGSGFDLGQQVKQGPRFPVVFMTALNSAENRLRGYDLGAEEFIPKPFHFRELLIRMQHVLETHAPSTVRIPLPAGHIDLDKMCVEYADGETIFLALKDFRLLELLVQQAPRPVTREEMLDRVWGEDQFPTERTVDNAMVRLRQVLRDEARELIRSVRGMGYQWTGPRPPGQGGR